MTQQEARNRGGICNPEVIFSISQQFIDSRCSVVSFFKAPHLHETALLHKWDSCAPMQPRTVDSGVRFDSTGETLCLICAIEVTGHALIRGQ